MQIANIGSARSIVFEFRKKIYYLLFNGYALFEITDKHSNNFLGKISSNDTDKQEAFAIMLDILSILSNQGELARRAIKLEPSDVFLSDGIDLLTAPAGDVIDIKTACIDAIMLGYRREITDEDEEIDMGLIELEKKSPNLEQTT